MTCQEHYLNGPKGRFYRFSPLGLTVKVRRYLGSVCIREESVTVDAARRLWAWLIRLGYYRW